MIVCVCVLEGQGEVEGEDTALDIYQLGCCPSLSDSPEFRPWMV